MIVMLRTLTIAGVRTAACTKLLMLFLAYFKAFLAPEPVNSFEAYQPALLPEFYGYPAITVPRMFHM